MDITGKNTSAIYLGAENARRFSNSIIFKEGASEKVLIQ